MTDNIYNVALLQVYAIKLYLTNRLLQAPLTYEYYGIIHVTIVTIVIRKRMYLPILSDIVSSG